MKPKTPRPVQRPSPPGNDPHNATVEIGRDEVAGTPRSKKSRRRAELKDDRKVNNAIHDGEKYLKR
jgi:hypothetical protein